MSPRDPTDRGTRIGQSIPSIATFVLAGLVLILTTHPTASFAEDTWEQLWADSFEHSMNEGWTLRALAEGDRVEVVAEGTRFPDRASRCNPDNNVLYGKSTNPDTGHGFSASTPALEDLGIDLDRDTYAMNFRYMVVGSQVCWTMPLISPHATLVISECTADGTRARLGVVDHQYRNFRGLAEIAVDEWYDIEVIVSPLRWPGENEVRIYLDDVLIDRHVRKVRSPQRGMTFVDLPAIPFDLDAENQDFQVTPNCFGEGYWDDVRLRVLRTGTETGPTKRDVTIDPNPFNPRTSICMALEVSCPLDVMVFDVRGRRVRELHAGVHPAGPVRLNWDGRDDTGRLVSSGVYLVRTAIPGETRVTRAVLDR
jgi:hypothetical protein